MSYVKCPIRGHKHEIQLLPHPTKRGRLVARCENVSVYETDYQPEKPARMVPRLDTMTVSELKKLPEWTRVPSPRPTKKREIVEAIINIRANM